MKKIVILLVTVLLMSCGVDTPHSEIGVQGGNYLRGIVKNSDSSGLNSAVAFLYKKSEVSSLAKQISGYEFISIDTLSTLGAFQFELTESGEYKTDIRMYSDSLVIEFNTIIYNGVEDITLDAYIIKDGSTIDDKTSVKYLDVNYIQVTDSTFYFSWNTNEKVSCQLVFAPHQEILNQYRDHIILNDQIMVVDLLDDDSLTNNKSMFHESIIDSLNPDSSYYFMIVGYDEEENKTFTDNRGLYYLLSFSKIIDVTKGDTAYIKNHGWSQISTSSVMVNWETEEKLYSSIVYSTSFDSLLKYSLTREMPTNVTIQTSEKSPDAETLNGCFYQKKHLGTLTNLSDKKYYYLIESIDKDSAILVDKNRGAFYSFEISNLNLNLSKSDADSIFYQRLTQNVSVPADSNTFEHILATYSVRRGTEKVAEGDTIKISNIYEIAPRDSIVVLQDESWVYVSDVPNINCLSDAVTIINSETGEISQIGDYWCSGYTTDYHPYPAENPLLLLGK